MTCLPGIKYRFCIETVDALCGSLFFSSIDVYPAFWQIAMAEGDKHKFAFRVDVRLLEPNVEYKKPG